FMRALRFAAVVAISLCTIAAAQTAAQEPNRSRKPGPDGCAAADPTYIHIANETGGQPWFLNPTEVTKAFHMVRESSRSDQATILWATGTFDAGTAAVDVPIDSTIRRVTFSLSAEAKVGGFTLTDPNGTIVGSDNPRAEVTTLNCGRIVTIDSPSPGGWHVQMLGEQRFWFVVHGQSDVQFLSAEFVHEGGRPGHDGLFKILGQPL